MYDHTVDNLTSPTNWFQNSPSGGAKQLHVYKPWTARLTTSNAFILVTLLTSGEMKGFVSLHVQNEREWVWYLDNISLSLANYDSNTASTTATLIQKLVEHIQFSIAFYEAMNCPTNELTRPSRLSARRWGHLVANSESLQNTVIGLVWQVREYNALDFLLIFNEINDTTNIKFGSCYS